MNGVLENIKRGLAPFTLKHLIIFILSTAVTTYITNYFLQYKLLKWLYIGIITVIIASLYNQGRGDKVVVDIFKLATV
jgi:hypothetical protein